MHDALTRRQVLIAGLKIATLVPTSLLFGCGTGSPPVQPTASTVSLSPTEDPLATRLHQELIISSKPASVPGQWTELAFNNLIDSMGEDSLKRTCKTLDIAAASVGNYSSNPLMKKEIKNTILVSSRGFNITRTDPDKILYHEDVLRPTARMMGLDPTKIETYDTLSLERAIYNRVFEQSWTSLNENERIAFLQQSTWNIPQDKLISLAALTGAGILAGLAPLVSLTGFSFYTCMSSGLYALASSMGIVVPFSGYIAASVAIKLATGPIGWVAAAILAGAGVYTWIKANQASNEATMLKTVLHMHHYKVSAMQEANIALTINGV